MLLTGKKTIPMVSWHRSSFVDDRQICIREAHGHSFQARPDDPVGGEFMEAPLWEVFIKSRQGLDHKHVGSLHAADLFSC